MDDRAIKVYRNRYAYRAETSYVWKLPQGVSMKKMQKHLELGIITEEMMCLMDALSELTVLSAKQVESFFWLDWIPESFKRIRADGGKNAYRNLLRTMESYGMLVPAQMDHEGSVVGSKVYGLSSGALGFIREYRGVSLARLSSGVGSSGSADERLGSNQGYAVILSLLSLNQMHLHVLKSMGDALGAYGRIWVSKECPANIYSLDGREIVVCSLRRNPDWKKCIKEFINGMRELRHGIVAGTGQRRYVLIAEDIDMILESYPYLASGCDDVFFTTDQEVFEGWAVRRYIRATGPKSYCFTQ